MPETAVAIEDGDFPIDGRPTGRCTYDGHRVESLPFDARTVEAPFDDADLAPRDRWAYPDTGGYERNVREFCAVVPARGAHGLRAVIVNLQYESPKSLRRAAPDGSDVPPRRLAEVGPARPTGARPRRRRPERSGRDLGPFCFGQDGVLADGSAVRRAAGNAVDLPVDRGDEHVVGTSSRRATSVPSVRTTTC